MTYLETKDIINKIIHASVFEIMDPQSEIQSQ